MRKQLTFAVFSLVIAMPAISVPLNQWTTQFAVLSTPTPSNHGPAKLPASNPSKSFWLDSIPGVNPLAKEGSEGSLVSDADICIIGSGMTGVSAAYHLSQSLVSEEVAPNKRASVVILEARDFCSGATGRNGGHLTAATYKHYHSYRETYGPTEALRSLAIENYTVSAILDIIRDHDLSEKVDLLELGHNELFLTEAEVVKAHKDLTSAKEAGVNVSNVKILTKEEMENGYGTSFPGIRFPGHNLWPLKLVTQLFKIAQGPSSNINLTLHTRTPVLSISHLHPGAPSSMPFSSSDRRYKLETPRGDISCSYIIHATNAHASHLLPHLTGPEGIIPTRGQVLALRAAVAEEELGLSGWTGNEGFEYWFPKVEGADSASGPLAKGETKKNPIVILGGGREAASPQFELYEEDDSTINPAIAKALKDFLPGLFEGRFEWGREPEMEWTGIMGMTKMGDPFVGPVLTANGSNSSYEGQYIAAGYSGHGMPRIFACAQIVSDMIISDIRGGKWSAPSWLPDRYLTWHRFRNGDH